MLIWISHVLITTLLDYYFLSEKYSLQKVSEEMKPQKFTGIFRSTRGQTGE